MVKINGVQYEAYSSPKMTKAYLSPPNTPWTQFVSRVIAAGGNVLIPRDEWYTDDHPWLIYWNKEFYTIPEHIYGDKYERLLKP